jgi:hypothetical protein
MNNWRPGVRFPTEAKGFSLLRSIQTGFRAHPELYPVGTREYFLVTKLPRHEYNHSFLSSIPVWRGLEYLHRSPDSRKRRRKGNPVPGGITGRPCSWGIQIREPGPQGSGSLRWDSKVWLRVLRDSHHWVIALQSADPSSLQRGRPHRNKISTFRQQPWGSK